MKNVLAQRVQEKDYNRVYEVDLHNARLTELEADLSAFSSLRSLDLSFNNLSSLKPEIMKELTVLSDLKIYANAFVQVGSCLRDCTRLERVDFNNNQLTAMDGFQTLKLLKYLSLDSNKITTIVNLDCNRNLTFLDLSRNQIRKIQGLDSLCNLQELHLCHNFIRVIENLKSLTSLVELDLSYNEISSDSADLPKSNPWRGLNKLQTLRLNHNRIQSLALLYPLPQLQDLYIQNNPLSGSTPTSEGHATPQSSNHEDSVSSTSSSAVLSRIAFLFPKLQVLDISHCGSSLIQRRADLQALSVLTELVEVNYKGSCAEDVELENSEITLKTPTVNPSSSVKTPGTSRSMRESRTFPFGVLPQAAGYGPSSSSASTSSPSVREGGRLSTAATSARPVMRPQTARSGGRDLAWSSQEAEAQFQQFLQQLEKLKSGCSTRIQNMCKEITQVFPTTASASAAISCTTAKTSGTNSGLTTPSAATATSATLSTRIQSKKSIAETSQEGCTSEVTSSSSPTNSIKLQSEVLTKGSVSRRKPGSSEGLTRGKVITPPAEGTLKHALTMPLNFMKRSQSLAVTRPLEKIKPAFEVPLKPLPEGTLSAVTRANRQRGNLTLPRKPPVHLKPLVGSVSAAATTTSSSTPVQDPSSLPPMVEVAELTTQGTSPQDDDRPESSTFSAQATAQPMKAVMTSTTSRSPSPSPLEPAIPVADLIEKAGDKPKPKRSSSNKPKPKRAASSAGNALPSGKGKRETSEMAVNTDPIVDRVAMGNMDNLMQCALAQNRKVISLKKVADEMHSSVDDLYEYVRGDEFVPMMEALVKELVPEAGADGSGSAGTNEEQGDPSPNQAEKNEAPESNSEGEENDLDQEDATEDALNTQDTDENLIRFINAPPSENGEEGSGGIPFHVSKLDSRSGGGGYIPTASRRGPISSQEKVGYRVFHARGKPGEALPNASTSVQLAKGTPSSSSAVAVPVRSSAFSTVHSIQESSVTVAGSSSSAAASALSTPKSICSSGPKAMRRSQNLNQRVRV